ncbi:aminodeoxychorismate synthase component I [Oceanobacter mangrovi]|uniref:aminodeoxychorismate synthase component I n=1 Tax=Oceanobacter mangrovi TaxID=2862510 RepID=UPI001C8D931E|nr:aminodeoxychorismate synthase component I [Oceanobacter mangrovi]
MPYFRHPLPFTADSLLQACHHLTAPALLYSGASGQHDSDPAGEPQRWAILAFDPVEQQTVRNQAEWQQLTANLRNHAGILSPFEVQPHERFISGWMGYFSYDAGCWSVAGLASAQPSITEQPSYTEQSSGTEQPSSTEQLAAASFNRYRFSLLLGLDNNQVELRAPYALAPDDLQAIEQQLEQALTQQQADSNQSPDSPAQPTEWQPAWNPGRYQQAFDQVQQYIDAGDVYQVNLTMPFYTGSNLTSANPAALLQHFDAPFSCYFRNPELTLFSVSPERFIKIEQQQMVTSPIKGTAPRGDTPAEDLANRQWLAASEKNQAENLMIVDLLRNDLGRSAEAGSVKVDKLFDIESHANVHHMVSTISARVKAELTPVDAIVSAFPGGSITGAPKKRAMEIIAELEAGPRGLYCGSFGYFSDQGISDFNILIRSIVATPTGAECWGGGGVVKDSTSESEYDEIFAKVQRLLDGPLG